MCNIVRRRKRGISGLKSIGIVFGDEERKKKKKKREILVKIVEMYSKNKERREIFKIFLEKYSILCFAGPRPELDPDVVAGLDDDLIDEFAACNPEDEDALPDNFVVMLNSDVPIHELENDDEEWEDCDEDDEDFLGNQIAGFHHLPALSKLRFVVLDFELFFTYVFVFLFVYSFFVIS